LHVLRLKNRCKYPTFDARFLLHVRITQLLFSPKSDFKAHKLTYSETKLTYSETKLTYSEAKLTYSETELTYSETK